MCVSCNLTFNKQVIYESAKCLWIILNKNLDWKPQIDQLCKKISSAGVPSAKFAYCTLYEVQIHTAQQAKGTTVTNNLERDIIQQEKAQQAGLVYRDSCREVFCQLEDLLQNQLYVKLYVCIEILKVYPIYYLKETLACWIPSTLWQIK